MRREGGSAMVRKPEARRRAHNPVATEREPILKTFPRTLHGDQYLTTGLQHSPPSDFLRPNKLTLSPARRRTRYRDGGSGGFVSSGGRKTSTAMTWVVVWAEETLWPSDPWWGWLLPPCSLRLVHLPPTTVSSVTWGRWLSSCAGKYENSFIPLPTNSISLKAIIRRLFSFLFSSLTLSI